MGSRRDRGREKEAGLTTRTTDLPFQAKGPMGSHRMISLDLSKLQMCLHGRRCAHMLISGDKDFAAKETIVKLRAELHS